MSWGIEYIHKGHISSVRAESIDDEIQQCEEMKKHYHDTLLCLCSSSPHDVEDGEGHPFFWEDYIKMRFTEIYEEMMDNEIMLVRLRQARDSKKVTSY